MNNTSDQIPSVGTKAKKRSPKDISKKPMADIARLSNLSPSQPKPMRPLILITGVALAIRLEIERAILMLLR
jgi:hypothetical protein